MSRQNTFFSRATPRAPKQLVIRRVGLALLFLLPAAVVFGDIEVKPQYEAHEPIVATVTITEVPEGAKLRGSIQIEGADYIPAGENVYHIWAKPGKYRIVATGVWVLTSELDVNGQKVPVLVDFGQYNYVKTFVVGEGDDPVPPPDPVPGDKTAVILEETEQRTPAESILFNQLVLDLKMQVLDDDQPSAKKYLPLLPASMSTVRPVMLVMAGETVVRVVRCPSSVAAVKEELSK